MSPLYIILVSSSAQVVFYLNHERTNQAQFTTTNSSKEMCRRVLMCEDNVDGPFTGGGIVK